MSAFHRLGRGERGREGGGGEKERRKREWEVDICLWGDRDREWSGKWAEDYAVPIIIRDLIVPEASQGENEGEKEAEEIERDQKKWEMRMRRKDERRRGASLALSALAG
jgi:hypothetical protein